MLLAAFLVTSLGLASGASLIHLASATSGTQDEGGRPSFSLIEDVVTDSPGHPRSKLQSLEQYAWDFVVTYGMNSKQVGVGRVVSAVTGYALPDDAESLELGAVHVPPFDIEEWDFGPSGLPEFIVRTSDHRLEWLQTGRDLRPQQARVIPGIDRVHMRRSGEGDAVRKAPVHLGGSRWLLNHGGWSASTLVVFDGATGATERLDLDRFLGEDARPILGTIQGDREGGATFEVLTADEELVAILTMGSKGVLIDARLQPSESLVVEPEPEHGGRRRSDGEVWRVGGGAGKSGGGEPHARGRELQRLDAQGNVVERLRSPLGPVYSEVTTRKPFLLDDGRILAREPGLPVVHVRNLDGSESRWARQGLATWLSAAVDGDGALWITGREPGSGELRSWGWSRAGVPLGRHFAKGWLGFDLGNGQVWSLTAEEADARWAAQLLDANGRVLAEHSIVAPAAWTRDRAVVPDWFVDDDGRAWLWLRFEEGSALWRFGPDGTLDAELQLAGYAMQGTELGVARVPVDRAPLDMRYRVGNELLEDGVPQRGPFAFGLRTERRLLGETRRWVIVDLGDLEALRFRYLGFAAAGHARTVHFTADGASVLTLLDQPASYTVRAMEDFIWIPVEWPGHFGR